MQRMMTEGHQIMIQSIQWIPSWHCACSIHTHTGQVPHPTDCNRPPLPPSHLPRYICSILLHACLHKQCFGTAACCYGTRLTTSIHLPLLSQDQNFAPSKCSQVDIILAMHHVLHSHGPDCPFVVRCVLRVLGLLVGRRSQEQQAAAGMMTRLEVHELKEQPYSERW